MSRPKVFIPRPLQPSVVERVAAHCDVKVHPHDAPMSPQQLAEACRDIDGLIACGARVTREIVDQAARLRVVANVGVGYDNIDVEACTRRRIVVTNSPGVLTEATADLTFALLVAVARRIVECDRYVREGQWQVPLWQLLWGIDLYGKTLGIIGFGRIGQAVARRARGFSMRIIYYSIDRPTPAVEQELGARFVEQDTLLRESDFVSLHVPLTPETRHLIGAAQLALMKPTAFLINAARGPVVEESALVGALQAKKIAGAGLDVFEHEPKIEPALLAMPNVVLAPHVGSGTAETRLAMANLAADNLLAVLAGKPPLTPVNPEILEGRKP